MLHPFLKPFPLPLSRHACTHLIFLETVESIQVASYPLHVIISSLSSFLFLLPSSDLHTLW